MIGVNPNLNFETLDRQRPPGKRTYYYKLESGQEFFDQNGNRYALIEKTEMDLYTVRNSIGKTKKYTREQFEAIFGIIVYLVQSRSAIKNAQEKPTPQIPTINDLIAAHGIKPKEGLETRLLKELELGSIINLSQYLDGIIGNKVENNRYAVFIFSDNDQGWRVFDETTSVGYYKLTIKNFQDEVNSPQDQIALKARNTFKRYHKQKTQLTLNTIV